MTLGAYIWGMRIFMLLSLGALGLILYYIDPSNSQVAEKVLFYLVLFFFLSAFFNLVLIFIRRKLMGGEMALSTLGLSFRQGILLSVIVIGVLVLQSYRMLVWWDGLLVIAGVFLIELYFLSKN